MSPTITNRPGFETVAPRPPSIHGPSSSTFPKVHLPASTDPPSPSNPPNPGTVWLIFGASGHMGRSLATSALSHNDHVIAVGQSRHDSLQHMQSWYPSHTNTASYLPLLCDVRDRASVDTVFHTSLTHFASIDIIAICHGYGLLGACEDQDDHETRAQFETNVFGTLNIIHSSLPYFREREAGRYLIFSSTSGALGVPGLGPYCATKYAVEGLVESLLYEVDQFNVKLTLVIAGHMRRDDQPAPPSHSRHASDAHTASGRKFQHFRILRPSPPYAAPDAPANHALRMLQWIGDNQPTSASKAAELTWQLGHCAYPPLRLLLGTFAVESIRDRLKSVIEEIEDWKELHFPPVEGMEEDGEGEEEEGDEVEGEGGEGLERSGGEQGGGTVESRPVAMVS